MRWPCLPFNLRHKLRSPIRNPVRGPIQNVGTGAKVLSLALAGMLHGVQAQVSVDFVDSLSRHLLIPNGLAWSDFNLQSAIGQKAQFRLAEVESVLAFPEKAAAYPAKLRHRLTAHAGKTPSIDSLLACLTLDTAQGLNVAWNRPAKNPGQEMSASISIHLQRFAEALTDSEWEHLRKTAEQMFVFHPDDTLLDAVTQERERLAGKQAMQRAYAQAQKLPFADLAAAARQMQALQQAMLDTVKAYSVRVEKAERPSTRYMPGHSGLRKSLRRMVRQAGLPWQEGSLKSENHVVSEGVFFDPGGDDTYRLPETGRPGRMVLIIDVDGDDVYLSRAGQLALPGFGGLLSILDLAGHDRYADRGFGFASGVYGISMVYDAAGDDVYEGGTATQGFGFFGIGLVHDLAGDDSYSAALFAQGSASTMGLGLVLDEAGNDQYAMHPVYVDDLRYQDHFLSMGQGFASGLMLGEAGGIGMLWDKSGHDTYTADIFAQGSGYWHALGLLLDDGGSDRYLAYQYAQGSGVHEALGFLLDGEGDDRYFSKGVSQGCGHDRGLGLLFDASGHDLYLATDMSQGAGSANGLGILFDAQGDDAYQALKPDRALGHADKRRDRGSFGLFYDGRGSDTYPTGRGNGEAWRTSEKNGSGNGFGLDR